MAANDAVSLTTIDDLPDECLREVMLGIPIQNRIHLRKVCKKWSDVIDDCWSAVKKIECVESTEQKNAMLGKDDIISIATSSRKIQEGVMKHCGDFITHLVDNRKDPEVSILQYAAKHCRNIKQLIITVSSKADDKYMNQLLAVNQKLRAIQLCVKFKNAKMCLRTICTDHLEELIIDLSGPNVFPPSILMSQKQIIRKSSFLTTLSTDSVDEDLIILIGEKIQLKQLSVTYRGTGSKKDTFHPILALRSLQELDIHAPMRVIRGTVQLQQLPMSDKFIVALADNLQLLEVLILNAPNISDEGFMHLASLPELRFLAVIGCPRVTDKFLHLFSKLEKMYVPLCTILDPGVIELLRKTQNMRELNVSSTLITNKTLIAAVEETRKRDNGIRLKLDVSDTNATPSIITDSSPLLEIVGG